MASLNDKFHSTLRGDTLFSSCVLQIRDACALKTISNTLQVRGLTHGGACDATSSKYIYLIMETATNILSLEKAARDIVLFMRRLP